MVLVLSRQNLDQLIPLFDRKTGLYAQMEQEIRLWLGPDHASVFARPEYENAVVRWNAEGRETIPWKRLDETQRQKLLVATRSILSDIQAMVWEHPRSVLANVFKKCRQFPSLDCLYAVDGRPVITAWGYADENGKVDLLENFSGPFGFHKTGFAYWRKFPWLSALMALSAGLLVSILWARHDLSATKCQAVYPPYDQVKAALNAQHENGSLVLKRNRLLDQWNILESQCKIPQVQPLVPVDPPSVEPLQEDLPMPNLPPVQDAPGVMDMNMPQEKVVPKPVPPPPQPQPEKKGDLPKDSWNKKDTSMLDGCWHLTTHLELYSHGLFFTSHQPVTNWSLCFTPDAVGKQVLTREDGGTCNGPLHAVFQGNQLVLNQPEDCQGDFHLIPGKNVCTRLNDHEARCSYIDEEGHQSTGIFKR